jgi:chromosome segregation ATPase
MSDEEEKQMVTFNIDLDTYQQAKEKLAHGEMSEELRMKLKRIAYGTDASKREQLREKLHTLREDKRDIESEINTLRGKRSEKTRKIERVEQRLDDLRDIEGEYNGALEMLESRLLQGERIYIQLDAVENAAQLGEKNKEDVLEDLKDRNPDVPAYAFELSPVHEPTDWREVER